MKTYSEAVNWILPESISANVSKLTVKSVNDNLESRLLFSALDSSIAGEVEEYYAKKGHIVVSNSKNHRWDKYVPLLIPEVNSDHLRLIKQQKYGDGAIVTNPNCSTIGMVLALKPLQDKFGLSEINVVTMQALSGAGYPGVSSLDIIDNVIPFIGGEEEKLESEPRKILGSYTLSGIKLANIKISAQTHRVAVLDGHLEAVQIRLKKKTSSEEIIKVWNNFTSVPQKLKLYSAPSKPIYYFEQNNYPQPKLHRDLEKGMAVSVGRLRKCNLFDYKFEVLSHNTVRGAAGGAILCAELMLAKKYI
jgi:aspartate-semialdehyde dehydrogenase